MISTILTLVAVIMMSHSVRAAQAPVDLQTAAPFAILSGAEISDAGNTSVITGNVGLSPATGADIGLFCSQVTGAIYSVDAGGPSPCRITNGPLLVTAKNNLTAAYVDAAGRTPLTTVSTELGGTTLVAGVYDSLSTTFGITAGAGALVLDGQNDPSSVFIFQAPFSGTGLNVGSASTITLVNGAQACNIFWRVDTAAINSTANFKGTILALNSITVANGATIEGRLLARNGNVTLINDTITVPTCASVVTPGGGSGTTPVNDDGTPSAPNTSVRASSSPDAAVPLLSAAVVLAAIVATLGYLFKTTRSRK